jgi:hypothetical protein
MYTWGPLIIIGCLQGLVSYPDMTSPVSGRECIILKLNLYYTLSMVIVTKNMGDTVNYASGLMCVLWGVCTSLWGVWFELTGVVISNKSVIGQPQLFYVISKLARHAILSFAVWLKQPVTRTPGCRFTFGIGKCLNKYYIIAHPRFNWWFIAHIYYTILQIIIT